MTLCGCGCGEEARPGRRYIKGHALRVANRKRKAAKLQSSAEGGQRVSREASVPAPSQSSRIETDSSPNGNAKAQSRAMKLDSRDISQSSSAGTISQTSVTPHTHNPTISAGTRDASEQYNKESIKHTQKRGFMSRILNYIFHRKKKPEIKEVETPEELIQEIEPEDDTDTRIRKLGELKPYEIPQTNPKSGIGRITKRDKDYIQVVLVSELVEPKMFWAEKTGLNRIQYKDRMFKLPRDIKGNVFFWHIDKKEPLVDSAMATENDAQTSFHELQLFNMAYSVGRAAGANELMSNLKLILLMSAFTIFLTILVLLYINSVDKAANADYVNIMNALNTINQSTFRR